MIILYNFILFILFSHIGKKNFLNLLIIFIYLVPCSFGNKIGEYTPPPTPTYALYASIIFIALIDNKYLQKSMLSWSAKIYLYYGLLISFIGFLLLPDYFLSLWLQGPFERLIRVSIYEYIFIFVPIIFFNFCLLNPTKINSLSIHVIKSGFIYSSIGIFQFIIYKLFSYDLFSVIRGSDGVDEILQSFFDDDGSTRVTSIVGEPRYLASFTSFWIFYLIFLWSSINIRDVFKWIILSSYIFVLIFTSSRTGFVSLIAVFIIIIYRNYLSHKKYSILVFFPLFLFSIFIFYLNLESRSMNNESEGFIVETNIYNLFTLGLEPPDYYTFVIIFENVTHLIFGVGAGLFQYYFDPFMDFNVYKYFSSLSVMDSWKSNIGSIFRLGNYGLIGLTLYIFFLNRLSLEFKISYNLNKNFSKLFYLIIIFIGLLKFAEIYAFVLLPTLLFSYLLKNQYEFAKHE